MKYGKHHKIVSNEKKKNVRNKKVSQSNIKNRSRIRAERQNKVGTKTINPTIWLIRIVTILIIVLCMFNINGIISYFTDMKTSINEFSINASYTVTFNGNDGAGTMNPQEISYNVATNLTDNGYTKTNYTFANWNTASDGSGDTYDNKAPVTNLGDITLYAQWTIDTYNITYTLDGGTVSTQNPTTYTPETGGFTLNNPTKTGYAFVGWSGTDLTGNTNKTVTIPQGSTGDRTYTANWILDITNAKTNDITIYDVDTRQIEIANSSGLENVASYTSNGTGVAKVSNTGLVTGVSAGTTTVTITGNSGKTKTVNVTIKPSYSTTKSVNVPKLTDGMIPIKWNNDDSIWVVCDENDSDWYTYGTSSATMLWANVMLSDGTYKSDTVEIGQTVAESDLGSMYVWIPRYSYQMPVNATTTKGTIDVTFLKKNTNVGADNVTYTKPTDSTNTETTKVVHPAFTLGSKELTGFWMAKFEMSGTNSQGQYVGNASASSSTPVAYEAGATIAKSLPNVPCWRYITTGESQYQSTLIAGDNKSSYGLNYASSHLIRNSEWGAVAYLCYSNYGNVPQLNGCGTYAATGAYDVYTGQGPSSSGSEVGYKFDASTTIADRGYSTLKGMLASTTGNITGIYDMNGGSWERVAAYLDNGNEYLTTFGKSSSNLAVKYFTSGALNSSYGDLWEGYGVSSEEKNNEIEVTVDGETSKITQRELWNDRKTAETYITARKRLTNANYSNMSKYKGIGVNEVSEECSFYTTFYYKSADSVELKQAWAWFKNVLTAINRAEGTSTAGEYARTWDDDSVDVGHAFSAFVVRGGMYSTGSRSGVLNTDSTNGGAYWHSGFRAAVVT